MAGYGIQPITGCELAVDFGDLDPNARNAQATNPARVVQLAARERGYRSLMRLNPRAFLETPVHQAPHIKVEWLKDDAEDLIALRRDGVSGNRTSSPTTPARPPCRSPSSIAGSTSASFQDSQ